MMTDVYEESLVGSNHEGKAILAQRNKMGDDMDEVCCKRLPTNNAKPVLSSIELANLSLRLQSQLDKST